MSEAPPFNFLIVRLGSLGDLVHTLPAAAALRQQLSEDGANAHGARLDWVVEEKWSPLIQMVEGVDRVIPLRRSLAGHFDCVRRLRQELYSCAVDFQGLYKSALLAWRSGARRRIGFDRQTAREPGAAWFYTERVKPEGRHVAELNASLAVRAGVHPPVEMRFPLRVPEDEVRKLTETLAVSGGRGDYIVVSPGGGWKSKCWPAERYGGLCREMWRRHNVRSVVNAGPGEDELAAAVVRASAPATPLVLCPSLRELCALVAKARMVIAADTGPLHLAAALGTRVVALFGPTDPARNGPLYPGGGRGMILRNVSDDANTYKRGGDYSPAMLSLTVEQVAAAVEREMGVA
jgi:lipopolysaccharide heptosyltransferase I